MKKLVVFLVIASALAAPCIYDISSSEPSPLAALFDMAIG